jgi:hypothetical protein
MDYISRNPLPPAARTRGRSIRLGDPARGRVESPADAALRRLFAGLALVLIATPRLCMGAQTEPPAARDFVLNDITPNPASVPVMIEYTLPRRAPINLTVHDPLGREIAHVACGLQSEGVHTVEWNGHFHGLPPKPGVFTVRLAYPGGQQSRQIVLRTKTAAPRTLPAPVAHKASSRPGSQVLAATPDRSSSRK